MWRRHQAVLSTQRWLLCGHYHHTSVGNQYQYHQLSTLRSFGRVVSYAATDKSLLQNKPSLLSASAGLPSLTRYAYVNQRISDPLFISSRAFSTRHSNRPRVPMMKDLHSIEEVILTAHDHLDVMSRRNISAVWARIALLMTKRQPRQRGKSSNNTENVSFEDMEHMLYAIFDDTTDGTESCGMRELSETTLGMAKIAKMLLQSGKRRGEDSSRVILRRLLLNADKKPNRDLFKFLANASMKSLDQFDARHLSNLTYAYALIGYVPEFDDGSNLFDHIAMEAGDIGKGFNAQDISNMVWAYATVSKSHTDLFDAMGDQVVASRHLNEFKPQALSNIVWAYATVGINHSKLFEKVANHIVKSDSLARFTHPQDFSNTVWAYATAGINHPKLFEAVANHIAQSDSLDRFNSQEFSNTLWAYATAGINHPKLFDRMANHIAQSDSLDQFKPQALSNTAWAYATVQVSHPKLFHKVTKAATHRKEEFNSQGVANLLWAYATMGIIDKQLFSSFVPTAAKSVDSYNNQEIANIAWAHAVADVDASILFNKDFIKKCVENEDGFEIENLRQLYQWHLWQTKEKSIAGLPQDFRDSCYETFISDHPTVSKLQDDVVSQLSSIGLNPEEEVLMSSGYRIDAVVEVNGKTFGVEVDGPSHFIGKSRSPLGSTILKRRQVPAIDGIELVSVPYWEWKKLGKSRTKKQEYLRKKLLGLAEGN